MPSLRTWKLNFSWKEEVCFFPCLIQLTFFWKRGLWTIVELLPVFSQMTYHGDSGNTCYGFPFQELPCLQRTCAQVASSESLFLQYRLFLPLKGYTSPSIILYPSYTSWNVNQDTANGLFWLLGVQFCVSLLQVSAPLSSTLVLTLCLLQGSGLEHFPRWLQENYFALCGDKRGEWTAGKRLEGLQMDSHRLICPLKARR